MEHMIYKLSLSMPGMTGGYLLILRDKENTMHHVMEENPELMGMFKTGESKIYVEGLWDPETRMVYLGARVGDQEW